MDQRLAALEEALLDPSNRAPCPPRRAVPKEKGIYALFAGRLTGNAWSDLGLQPAPNTPPTRRDLLYIGVATDGFRKRYHPAARSCRTSSPRFSFGALLREKFGLVPAPARPHQTAHWRFEPQSERWLSDWMNTHLEYACIASEEQRGVLEAFEANLIRKLSPPLNIKGLPAGSRVAVTAAREACRRLARGSLS